MLRLVLLSCALILGCIIAIGPSAQFQSPTAVEYLDTEVTADRHDSNHPACDFSCFGCGHSVHDMCPSTPVARYMVQQVLVVYRVQLVVRDGHHNSLLRPPISPTPQLV